MTPLLHHDGEGRPRGGEQRLEGEPCALAELVLLSYLLWAHEKLECGHGSSG